MDFTFLHDFTRIVTIIFQAQAACQELLNLWFGIRRIKIKMLLFKHFFLRRICLNEDMIGGMTMWEDFFLFLTPSQLRQFRNFDLQFLLILTLFLWNLVVVSFQCIELGIRLFQSCD
eukprot:TRINITY_DN6521_c0_g1_i4.p1 TRINITY_DN6521_c0_g1~~TRINITY_DN6521_c0_g1_i4.p1  ORF type:complete len:117 (-),score=0.72 TRINITY_DN6521_c0_g1_i4:252-602(-)